MGVLAAAVPDMGLAALELAVELGWPVFPLHSAVNGRCSCGKACSSPAKHPRTPNGLHDATTHPEQVAEWWDREPDSNIGIVTGEASGIVVIDVDGEEGEAALAALGDLPVTPESRTAKGRHLVFARPSGGLRNSAGRLGVRVDVRGDGGYIVAPPSLHISGRRYQWITDPFATLAAPLPEFLLRRLSLTVSSTPAADIPAGSSIGPGARNSTLVMYAGRLLAKGHNLLEVLELVSALNVVKCKPPLPRSEVEQLVQSIADAEARKQGAKHATSYRFYSAQDLDLLPTPTWRIHETLPDNGLIALLGPKGVMKTFVALDLAAHIATGTDWHGRKVIQGPVAYIYAEGPFGAKTRVEAWCQYQSYCTGTSITRADLPLYFLPSRLPLNDPGEVEELIRAIQELPEKPVLIVVDTLNRNLDGDEDGKGMTGFVEGCATLQERVGAGVMPVHHTPLSSEDRGRGHTAFDGAVDTRLIVSRDVDRICVECTHQRNGPDGWMVAFEAVPVAGSIALKPLAPNAGELKGNRLLALQMVPATVPVKHGTWMKQTELSPSKFRRAREWLVARAYVDAGGGQYSLTDSGKLALSASGASAGASANGTGVSVSASGSPPLRGETGTDTGIESRQLTFPQPD